MWWLRSKTGKAHIPSRKSVEKLTTSFLLHVQSQSKSTLWITAWQILWCTHGVKRVVTAQKAAASKGICAVHARHSFLPPPRDLKQNRLLSPPPTARFLSYMCALMHKGIYFKVTGCVCHTQEVSIMWGLQLCPSPEEERGCHSAAGTAGDWTMLLPWII